MIRTTLVLTVLAASLGAQRPGFTSWAADDYAEYVEGNLPLLITAGHGGALRPAEIPERTYGVTTQDAQTQPLTRELVREIVLLTGRMPHVVYSHLHRSRLDPNREIVEAAQGHPIAERAWRDYHGFVDLAKSRIAAQWGTGLYIDVHGHGHTLQWMEWGYALDAAELALSDAVLAQQTYVDQCTFKHLANQPSTSFIELLRGQTSFGGLMETRGYTGVPSPSIPHPGSNPYFRGGYSVQRHGSRDGGTIDAVQIELPSTLRRDVPQRRAMVRRFAESIVSFLETHYGFALSADPRVTVVATEPFTTESGVPAVFRVSRTGDLSQAFSAPLLIGGTANSGIDYQAVPAQATFAPGQAEVELSVVPIADASDEGSETVSVLVRGGIEVGQPNRATVVIEDVGPDPTLCAHWPLDSTSGGTTPDTSGNGRDAALRPSATTGPGSAVSPRFGALSFDGSNDRLEVADFPYAPNGQFTVAFWFRTPPTNDSDYQYVLGHGGVGVPNSLNVWFVESTAELRTALQFANDRTPLEHLDVPDDFMDGAWHHYALVAQRSGLSFVAIDGEIRAQGAFSGDSFDPAGTLLLGIREDLSSSRFFSGVLDDVRIWNRALDLAELRVLVATLPGRYAAYGTGCTGSGGVPTLSGEGMPATNRSLRIELTGGPASSPAVLALGASRTAWAGGSLPMPLDVIGAPGCTLLQDLLALTPSLTDASGATSFDVPVPANAALVGRFAFLQCVLLDPAANALGLTASNGLEALFGG